MHAFHRSLAQHPLKPGKRGAVAVGDQQFGVQFRRPPKFINKTDKRLISFRPNGQKCYNKSAVRLALAG